MSFAFGVVLWGGLPGLALARALPLQWSWADRAAAAPGLSLALVAFSAYAAELVGLRVAPLPVLAIVAGMLLVLLVGGHRRQGAEAPAASRETTWAPWLVWLLPLVVVAQLEPLSTIPVLPPTLHDGLDHANWFRLIYETQSVNPHEVLAPPLGPGGAPTYYPWGLHAWMALIAQTSALDPIVAMSRSLVLVSAAIPLSVYVFTAYLLGRGPTATAAAVLSLAFWWLPYQVWGWGGYPLLAGAAAALPLCRLALTAVTGWMFAPLAATVICALGVLLIHPSQAMFALLAATIVSVTLAAGREVPRRVALCFLLVFGATAAALILGERLWPPAAEFMQRAHEVAARHGEDPRHDWPVGVYFDNTLRFPHLTRGIFGLLAVAGGIVALFGARARPLLVLHLVVAVLLPLARYQTWLTSLWYHLPERLWYMQYASLPALAALGVGGIVHLTALAARRRVNLAVRPYVIWPLALGLVVISAYEYATWATKRLTSYSRDPHQSITDKRVLVDFAWMRENIPRGEVIFNAPADWGLPLPFTGHRTVFWSGGYAIDPSVNWNRILHLLRTGDPLTSHGAAELSWRGIRYVYSARVGGGLERGGRLSLDGETLQQSEAFELLYASPTARVFRIRDFDGQLLGLQNSEVIQFEGFHEVESDDRRRWRWSEPAAALHLRGLPEGSAHCFVRILGPDPDTYQARIAERPLELTDAGWRIPEGQVAAGEVTVTLESPRMPAPAAETRALGVSVRDVGLRCR